MKVNDSLKLVDAGWVKKATGYRVRFQRFEDGQWHDDLVPESSASALDSDVVAWRLAWKLAQAGRPKKSEDNIPSMANICVVDDAGQPVKYYVSNQLEVFNPLEIE